MKTTLKEIKKQVAWGHFIDLDEVDEETFEKIRESYNIRIAYSAGKYGMTGVVYKSSYDRNLYAFVRRSTRFFMM